MSKQQRFIRRVILSFLVLTSFATWATSFYTDPAPSHWWNLNEKRGTIAYDFVDDDDGTFSGDEPNQVEGKYDSAVDFNGISDYFAVSSLDNSYLQGNVFTVTGWFKTSQSTGIQTIAGNWSQTNPIYSYYNYQGWQVLVESNKVVARCACDGPDIIDVIGPNDVNDGQWHHFAFVYSGFYPGGVLYVDGYEAGTHTNVGICAAEPTKFRIGDGSYITSGTPVMKGGLFKGIIDDIRIYDEALSAENVNQLYEAEKPSAAFSILNDSDDTGALFDNIGNLLLKGDLDSNTTPVATTYKEFRIQDSDSCDVVAIIDTNDGIVDIQGTLFENQTTLTPSAESSDFVIKDANGVVIIYIDEDGNLYLKGQLYEEVLKEY